LILQTFAHGGVLSGTPWQMCAGASVAHAAPGSGSSSEPKLYSFPALLFFKWSEMVCKNHLSSFFK